MYRRLLHNNMLFNMLQRELNLITLLVLLCQHGVKAVEIHTCEGETASPTCAQGTIKVLAANFGRTNTTACSTGWSVTQLSNIQCTKDISVSLASQCDGNQNCSIIVNTAVFGDPCPGIYKYMNVSYTCVLPAEVDDPICEVNTAGLYCEKICQNKLRTISCEEGRTISVQKANYGKRDFLICPHSDFNATSSKCNSPQTKVLHLWCKGKRHCNLYASSLLFLDQCPHIYKYLEVSYSCV
ncbi:L-rhamnose-binding lectin CSL2-like [Xyrauchen texanus]|uniref:L-rhamnose-binding lectin CSL2-like n=1 Tax=Xyrauchen texanus TaxID=154827 RepID=UPI002242B225|nr:L-rhamnose-binding lectin CSL2-like [Xyrauchen texanus]